MARRGGANGNGKRLASQQSVNEARGYDLKAVNPHARIVEDTRTPEELLDIIEAKGREVAAALESLRALLKAEPGGSA